MKNLIKPIKSLTKNTKQMTWIVLCSMLIFIIFQIFFLLDLKKNVNNSFDEMNNVVKEAIIQAEPDYLDSDLPHKKLGKFNLSWYSPKELGKTHAHELRTSKGKIPKDGRTIAVDPKVIPYGSIIYIQDYGYFTAEDTGGAIKGNRIDIYTDSHSNALQQGRKVKNVYLLDTRW